MAIFTFSTKGSKPTDTKIIERVKQHCDDKGLNFSSIVVKLIKEWYQEELANGE